MPAPTPQIYIDQEGRHALEDRQEVRRDVDELLAANKETIKDPNKITVGQEIIIPVPTPDEVDRPRLADGRRPSASEARPPARRPRPSGARC